jgi:hypothetical protein
METFLIYLFIYWLSSMVFFGCVIYYNYKVEAGVNGAMLAIVSLFWPILSCMYFYEMIRRRFAPVA